MITFKGSPKGQVAIFAALMFQVLFIFFAMVVNVGLLVYHKINLQNSVDLAAYYGAMKQAEVLSAISHTNYQIRQSWKLLNFRYRALGMAGNSKDGTKNPFYCTNNLASDCKSHNGGQPATLADDFNPQCFTSYCNAYNGWGGVNSGENRCNNSCEGMNLTMPGMPTQSGNNPIYTPITVVVNNLMNLSTQVAEGNKRNCKTDMAINWLTLAAYVLGYKADIMARREVIHFLGNSLSYSEQDFDDLDGLSAKDGVTQTFKRNLTPPLADALSEGKGSMKFINFMGSGRCRGQPQGNTDASPPWLIPIDIAPLYLFMDEKDLCQNETSLDFIYKFLGANNHTQTDLPDLNDNSINVLTESGLSVDQLKQINSYLKEPDSFDANARKYASISGYEKDPWCMAYVGVEASIEPKIPFAPLGRITLKASAFAKPFGGNIGPWYTNTWKAGEPTSSNIEDSPSPKYNLVDKKLPYRNDNATKGFIQQVINKYNSFNSKPPGNLSQPEKEEITTLLELLQPNYSRFVGDKVGLRAAGTIATWNEAIFKNSLINGLVSEKINPNIWVHLLGFINNPTVSGSPGIDERDFLAKNPSMGTEPRMRQLEISAILPDQFDLMYYNIESNAATNIVKRLSKNQLFVGSRARMRYDFGYSSTRPTFSIKDQLESVAKDKSESALDRKSVRLTKGNFQGSTTPIEISGLGYIQQVKDYGQTTQASNRISSNLTSWHTFDPGNYILDDKRFGICNNPIPQTQGGGSSDEIEATPSDCVAGGRSGYSVKLISREYLFENLEIGGKGITGKIKNPPPPL